MKKEASKSSAKIILIGVILIFLVAFLVLPLAFFMFDSEKIGGNVAMIPLTGPITSNGGKIFGEATVSSTSIVEFIEEAGNDPSIQAIVIEINSPGGSAVASDEIATAIKKTEKPVISLIREVGASGGYWVASSTDHVIAHRMSITGSIGVISSYLEFSGLMEEYGVGYERLVAGKNKDIGSPFRKLERNERELLQKKIDRIHDYFIEEISENRNLPSSKVRSIATGEFFIGIEALDLGLIDELGDKDTVKSYIEKNYDISEVNYVRYERQPGFFESLAGVFQDFSFEIGQGFGSIFLKKEDTIRLQ